jgi:anti-anti-sigma factor
MNQQETFRRGPSRHARRPVLHAAPIRVHRLALTGELGHDTAVAVEAAIDDLCASGVERLVLDLSELRAIDRTGVDVIAMRCGLCTKRGVVVDLVDPPPAIAAAFEEAGLAAELPFRENPLVRQLT